jgi:hypothetical protein
MHSPGPSIRSVRDYEEDLPSTALTLMICAIRMSFTKDKFQNADLVLVTSDDVHLYVHRTILEVASPFFKGEINFYDLQEHRIDMNLTTADMLSLPQPLISTHPSVLCDDTNKVNILEDAESMCLVLSLTYPFSRGLFPKLSNALRLGL